MEKGTSGTSAAGVKKFSTGVKHLVKNVIKSGVKTAGDHKCLCL